MAATSLSVRLLWLLLVSTALTSVANADKTVIEIVHTSTKTVQALPTAPSSTSYTSPDDFKNIVLQVTNHYRHIHKAQSLAWNETLTDFAWNWSNQCIWQHSVRLLSHEWMMSNSLLTENLL